MVRYPLLFLRSLLFLLGAFSVHADTPKVLRPELALQIGHSHSVSYVALSPDGTMVASAEFDAGAVNLWDARSGDVLRTWREPGISFVWALRFSPDSSLLTVTTQSGLKLWHTRTGALALALPGNSLSAGDFAFSPDGRYLAQAAYDFKRGREVELRSLPGGELLRHITLGGTTACALCFAPDGKTLLSLRVEENLIRTWDIASGEQRAIVAVDSKGGGQIIFSADGTLMAFVRTTRNVPEIVVCELQTGKTLHTLKVQPQGNSGVAINPNLAVAPDGKTLVAACHDHTFKLWNPRSGELLQTVTLPEQANAIGIAFSADGKTLVAGASNGSVLLYDFTAPATPRLARTLRGRSDFIVGVRFSADGSTILSESISSEENDPQLREWDARSGALRRTTAEKEFLLLATVQSPDGRLLARATGGFDKDNKGSVQLLDAQTHAVIRTLPDTANITSVAFINGGKTLVGGMVGKNLIRLWDVTTGTVRQNVEIKSNFQGLQTFVAASPDGRLLAAGESFGSIRVWDGRQESLKEPLQTFAQEKIPVVATSITFAPDNATLAIANSNGTLLLDTRTGQKIRSLPEHGGYVFALAYSPDGQRFATAGESTVKIWNPQDGRLLATLYNFPADNKTAAEEYLVLTPEGYYAGSAAADRYVKFRLGDTLYPAESFQAHYYRPDLVQKALNGEELPPLGEFKGPFPPLAKIGLAPTDKSLRDSVNVELSATDDSAIKNIAFFVNGARVDAKPLTAESRPLTADARALTADARPLTADSRLIPQSHKIVQRYTATLPLPPGATNIKVQAIVFDDDGLQSPRDEILFTRETAAPATGKLLGLCVGVSQYQDTRLNLKFADADAKALTQTLGLQRGIYSATKISALTNEQATVSQVKSALDALIQTTTRADTVTLSLSGHGWRDDERNFYFATYEVNRNDVARTALPWQEITGRLTQLSQKSKRVIVLLDACHSGSAATNEELVKATLAANAGVLVFASSRGSEVSLENDEWGHGVFTKALIEAIEGKAAPEGENKTTMLDFLSYVARRVKTLTQDQQHPQVPFLQDFDTDAALVTKP